MSIDHHDIRTTLHQSVEAMANLRQRPCLLCIDPFIDPHSIALLSSTLGNVSGEAVDLVLHSAGGCPCCAYTFARQLRRRFGSVTVFVPLHARSGATLLALIGSEVVFGEFGSLGPLDA